MSQKKEFELKQRLGEAVRPKTAGFDAFLGDGQGNVEVSGHPEYWYARPMGSELPIIVKRGAAPKLEGVRVRVEPEFDDDRRSVYGVRTARRGGWRVSGVTAWSGSAAVESEPHGDTHLAGGSDPIYIDSTQVVNGLVYASGDMELTINAGWAIIYGQPVHWNTTTLDVSGDVPVSGALFGVVQVDAAGTISLLSGSAVGSYADLSWADVPAVETDKAGLALVRLYEGQTALSKVINNPDVFDVRMAAMAPVNIIARRHVVYWTFEGALVVAENPLKVLNLSGVTRTIVGVYLIVSTAPTGAAIIVDVHKEGTTIFTTQSNRPEVAISATTGNSTTVEVPAWADGEYLTVAVDQAGSTAPGSYLTVHVVYTEVA